MKIFHAWVRKLTVFLLIICHFQSNADSIMKNKTVIHKGIHKRGLFYPVLLYPYNACSGILVAIAVPLNLPNRNVFVSYNFEANYNMPNQPGDSVPGMINRFPGLNPPSPSIEANAGGTPDDIILKRSFEKSDAKNSTEASIETETEIIVEKRSVTDSVLLSRKGVYRLLESRLNANMLNGKKCLLLAICESSKYPLLEANGVLGHVFHIVLTPSTSMEENLPPEYAKAENLGRLNDCQKYEKHCNFNLLTTFTKLF